jgi:hypothetical protein
MGVTVTKSGLTVVERPGLRAGVSLAQTGLVPWRCTGPGSATSLFSGGTEDLTPTPLIDTIMPVGGFGTGMLTGMYPDSDAYSQFQTLGKASAPYQDLLTRYVDFSNVSAGGQFPSTADNTAMADGSMMRFAWVNVQNGSSYDTGSLPTPGALSSGPAGKNTWTYSQIYGGSCDTYLEIIRGRLADLSTALGPRKPFLIDFNHEMESESAAPSRRYSFSDPADPDWSEYGQAVRYIIDFFRSGGGVTNALWGCVYAALTNSPTSFVKTGGVNTSTKWNQAYPGLYVGDGYMDWVGFDPYESGGNTTFNATLATKYNALDSTSFFPTANFPFEHADFTSKPRIAGEYGNEAGGSTAGSWMTGLPAAWAAVAPKVIAAIYFLPSSDFSGSPTLVTDYKAMLADSYMNPTLVG